MAVKIRLARRGRRKKPYYHIVVADARAPRDGKFIEQIGSYNPMTRPATIILDSDKAYDWLMKGAQPTDTARAILRFKGVMYKKHLQRGVSKGALTQEQADQMLAAHIEAKEAKVSERIEETKKERLEFLKKVSGSPKKQYVEEIAATEALKEFQETDEPVAQTENTEKDQSDEAISAEVEETGEATASEDSGNAAAVEDVSQDAETEVAESVTESSEGENEESTSQVAAESTENEDSVQAEAPVSEEEE